MIDFFDSFDHRPRRRYGSFEVFAGTHLQRDLHLALTVAVCITSGILLYDSPDLSKNLWQASVLMACAAISAYLCKNFWQLYHYIADTPTSRVASAAQGLVELHGTGDLLPGTTQQGIAMGPPCLWQSYVIMDGESVTESGVSRSPFQLTDGSGHCVIYPAEATVISSSHATPRSGRFSAEIHYLRPGADIYVLGALRAVGGDNCQYDLERETLELLRKWKTDQRQLVAEFDRDGDGRIDVDEWQAAREKARTIAAATIQRKRVETKVTHEIRKPSNGLPLIISDKDPQYLERRFFWLGMVNLGLAAACFVVGALKFS